MKTVWIFGGSFCSGYRNGGGANDWVAQLNADVTVWATAPQSPLSQSLMLDHAFDVHLLERKLQDKPDYIIYDYPPNTRINLPTELLDSERSMLNFKDYNETDHTHKFECGCQGEQEPHWDISHLSRFLKKDADQLRGPKRRDYKQFVIQTQRKILNNELPLEEDNRYTVLALDRIKESGIPFVWFCANNEAELSEHQDTYIDIMSLQGSIPTQTYNSKTFNHLSIQQNLAWANFFNKQILDLPQ